MCILDNPPASGNILLCVTGLSPQVVTETLYALAMDKHEPFIPQTIYLLTTTEGARRARQSLLDLNWFNNLREDYDLPEIEFGEQNILILRDRNDNELNDIRSPEDNIGIADYITETVRTLTQSPDTKLHVSIAGGRKTMGFYLGYALTLFGRETDKLSHVLVSSTFESSWNFFYPTPYSQIIHGASDEPLDSADAEVTLANIPFVSMRNSLPENMLTGQTSFSEAVSAAQAALRPPKLIVCTSDRSLNCNGVVFEMPPALFALYLLFVEHLLADGDGLHYAVTEDMHIRLLDIYRRLCGAHSASYVNTEERLRNGVPKDYFDYTLSRVNRSIRQALGSAAQHYIIRKLPADPYSRYGLFGLKPAMVRLEQTNDKEILD